MSTKTTLEIERIDEMLPAQELVRQFEHGSTDYIAVISIALETELKGVRQIISAAMIGMGRLN